MGNFIAGAVKRPGALRRRAQAAGQLTQRGTIKVSWLRAQAKVPGRIGRQARFALQVRKFATGRR